jgi:hypothetical protein
MGNDDEFIESYISRQQIVQNRGEVALRAMTHYRVFISYARVDQRYVEELTDLLDRRRVHYAIDEKSLEWGDDIRKALLVRLTECTHYLLVLTETSAKSPWCSWEKGVADALQKKVLIFQADAAALPPFAMNVLATADLSAIERYFSQELIERAAVNKLIDELLDLPSGRGLDRFVPSAESEGRVCWDHPERLQLEDARASWLDDVRQDDSPGDLVRIELGEARAEPALVLRYRKFGFQPQQYTFSYDGDLKALVVKPRKHGSDPLAGRSVEEMLKGRTIYGWQASLDFWTETLSMLRGRLPNA